MPALRQHAWQPVWTPSIQCLPNCPNPDPCERAALGSTGLLSTVPGFMRLAQMLPNGGERHGVRIPSRDLVALMASNHLGPDFLPAFHVVGLSDRYFTQGYGFGSGGRVLIDRAAHGIPSSTGEYGLVGNLDTLFLDRPKEGAGGGDSDTTAIATSPAQPGPGIQTAALPGAD